MYVHVSGVGDRNHWRITHEPRTYHLQSLTNHWHIAHVDAYEQIRCSIPRTLDARPMHESLNQWMSVEWTWYVRGSCVIWTWGRRTDGEASVDVRGFEPVPTHKHWRPTRVPRIVTQTRRINNARRRMNYAHRRMNYAHRRTVVRRKNFEPFKTQITHKPPSTHIHLQSLTVHLHSTDELRTRRTLRAETKICA